MRTSYTFLASALASFALASNASIRSKASLADMHLHSRQADGITISISEPTAPDIYTMSCVQSTAWVTVTTTTYSSDPETISTAQSYPTGPPPPEPPFFSTTGPDGPPGPPHRTWSPWTSVLPLSSIDDLGASGSTSLQPSIATPILQNTIATSFQTSSTAGASTTSGNQISSQTSLTTSSNTMVVSLSAITTSSPVQPSPLDATSFATVSSSSSLSSPTGSCHRPLEPYNHTSAIGNWYGLNVVNQKPAPGNTQDGFKGPEDWNAAFSRIKKILPHVNAVRMYSTMDPLGALPNGTYTTVQHLENALPSAKTYGLKILAGIYPNANWDRFGQELAALGTALQHHGCDDIIAVSVGNEDLNNLEHLPSEDQPANKAKTVDMLVNQIDQTRDMLDFYGCCHVPVTHTDTWNEIYNPEGTDPWVEKLIQACDSFLIVDMYPYWQNATLDQAYGYMTDQAAKSLDVTSRYGKDLWLGETGWPRQDQGEETNSPANPANHQAYFNQIGCQVLSGSGSAFYYVDWDEDGVNPATPLAQQKPSFGIMSWDGAALIDTACDGFEPASNIDAKWPMFMGGQGMAALGY